MVVLERFFVNPDLTPSIRIAQMYPNGDGLRVFAPFGQDGPSNKMADGKLKTAEGMIQALKDHFDGKSKPLLRSQPRPGCVVYASWVPNTACRPILES